MQTIKNTTIVRCILIALLLLMIGPGASSQQRLMEKLNRGTVAAKTDDGVLISWRKFANDPENISFNVYRNKVLVNTNPITGVSNFLDENGTENNFYYIEVLNNEEVTETSNPVVVWKDGYKDIPLQTPEGYEPEDASAADLDGDGEMEIIVKMQGTHRDNSQSGYTDPVLLHAYKLNGKLLWSINLGINIRAGSHYTQFMVYDLNGDGFAEMACKTAPGTMDATGSYLSNGPAATDDDAADYRNSSGYILSGPEYLTLFDGKSGKEISTVDYNPGRGNVRDWGDTYGNRVDRFLACVAYFDTIPSLVMCRGYYTRSVLAAWDYQDGELVQRWVFDTDIAGTGADGNTNNLYAGQGAHSLSVGDVDGDGKDEIVYGAMAIDDDGTGLWTSGNNHGDATHLGDFLPERPGMEYWMPSESAYSTNKVTGEKIPAAWLADAATGAIIWQKDVSSSADVGRAMVANVSSENPGCEFWAASPIYNIYDQNGNAVSYSVEGPSINFGSWWDGDLLREILSGNSIKKWTPSIKESLLEPAECASNNSTKAVPALSGDILGDWREEVIWRTSDNQNLRIFTTPYPTDYGFYTLLQDPQYRLAITWQNVGYNQPPHPSFYVGDDMDALPEPNIKMLNPTIDPAIEITSPTNGALIQLGNNLAVTFSVYGISDTTKLYINNGDVALDTIKGAPYAIIFDLPAEGNYALNAWCVGADQQIIKSDTIHISVDAGIPHITLTSPEDGSLYGANDASIFISAEAYDSDGTIANVTFYMNNVQVAELTSAPYELNIDNPGDGTYTIAAVATDDMGNQASSDTITFEVETTVIIQEEALGFCGFLTSGYIESNHDGYTGDGFSNTANAVGAGLSYAVNIVESGTFRFAWRYATSTDRAGKILINDAFISNLDFLNTSGSWDVWELQYTDEIQLDAGTYEIQVVATTSGGLGNIDYLKVVSVNQELVEAVSCDSLHTGIRNTNLQSGALAENILLYPNPASNEIYIEIESENGRIEQVQLIDITGKEILNKELNSKNTTLDISNFESGIYLVKLHSNHGTCVKRLVVE